MKLSTLLRRNRKRLKLSQQSVADKAEIDVSAYASLELGRSYDPKLTTAARLCDALELDADQVMQIGRVTVKHSRVDK